MRVLLYLGIMLIAYGLVGGSLPAMISRNGGGGGGDPPPCPGNTCDNGCSGQNCINNNCANVKVCGCSAAGGGADCQYCSCDVTRTGCQCL